MKSPACDPASTTPTSLSLSTSTSKSLSRPAPENPRIRLWEYLVAQLTTPGNEDIQHGKHQRVYNFLHVPQKLEQLLFLGYMVCLDSFLYNFTVLPARIAVSSLSLAHSLLTRCLAPKRPLPFFSYDLLRGLLLLIVCALLQTVDSSRLYHSIRGQSVIKLYVIFNVFEILDKLCCSFGLDILDSFFSPSSKAPAELNKASRLNPTVHFALTVCYVFVHTIVLLFQAITLNVAINSFSSALLTLLVSNQFVEIKSAVFKKFEKENLFQLSCADITERFQLSLYLVIIMFRNLTQVSTTVDFAYFFEGLVLPVSMVFCSEILVDWLKHAFITKFNNIHPDVYIRFVSTICKDFETDFGQSGTLSDQSPAVSRRIGFSSFPLACLIIRILIQTLDATQISLFDYKYAAIMSFAMVIFVKIFLGISLIKYTRHCNTVYSHGALKREADSHKIIKS